MVKVNHPGSDRSKKMVSAKRTCALHKMLEGFNNTDDIGSFLADDLLLCTDFIAALQAAAEVTVEEDSAFAWAV